MSNIPRLSDRPWVWVPQQAQHFLKDLFCVGERFGWYNLIHPTTEYYYPVVLMWENASDLCRQTVAMKTSVLPCTRAAFMKSSVPTSLSVVTLPMHSEPYSA